MGNKHPRLRCIGPLVPTIDTRSAKPPPKEADPHYLTPEHRAWRAAVIKRAGGRCEWPGCGRAESRMFADHIKELKDGGAPLDLANGQCLCGSHHTTKTARAREARMRQ
jgi:5-methylcytosine-specific restriction protein A